MTNEEILAGVKALLALDYQTLLHNIETQSEILEEAENDAINAHVAFETLTYGGGWSDRAVTLMSDTEEALDREQHLFALMNSIAHMRE